MFGEILRKTRKERGLTQADLGRRIGVSHVRISNLEKMEGPPRFDTVEKLAHALGCNVTALLNIEWRSNGEPERPELIKILKNSQKKIRNLETENENLKAKNLRIILEAHHSPNSNGSLIKSLNVLGIDKDHIKRVFREKAKETHPDHGGKNENFRNVKEAFDAIDSLF